MLAFAAYKNTEECFILLFNHALEFNLNYRGLYDESDKLSSDKNSKQFISFEEKKIKMTEWVNAQTDEGFTALHFATYHGNFPLIKYLIDNANADMSITNKFGSSVLHIAAQGD